jgi:hypothetical protein
MQKQFKDKVIIFIHGLIVIIGIAYILILIFKLLLNLTT